MVKTSKIGARPVAESTVSDELGLTAEQRAVLLQSIAQGETQYQTGEAIPGADVLAWIRSWGTKKPLPTPTRKTGQR
jgi:predicted transcriptional regulator